MGKTTMRGFTLVELMIVVVILSIIAAVAYPSYKEHVRKARRTDAKAMLMQVAQQQERWFTRKHTYAPDLSALGFVNDTEPSEDGHYNVSISVPGGCSSGLVVSCYLVTATAVSGGLQANDTGCTSMTIDERGQELPAACW